MRVIGFKQFKMENHKYPNKWVTSALTISLNFFVKLLRNITTIFQRQTFSSPSATQNKR